MFLHLSMCLSAAVSLKVLPQWGHGMSPSSMGPPMAPPPVPYPPMEVTSSPLAAIMAALNCSLWTFHLGLEEALVRMARSS